MKNHDYTINKTVRYVTIGSPTAHVKDVWVCLHGYGQLAVWFARNFAHLELPERLFVVPEGPHRFYLQGTSGRVGASWMTKEDRLSDIEDQFNYLESLLARVKKDLSPTCKVHILGFSQGVSTAFRWLLKSQFNFATCIFWAGSFPPEIDYAAHSALFNAIKISACFGDEDEYISSKNAKKFVAMLTDVEINADVHFYIGGHRINRDLLTEVLALHEA
jgi:predicted esterase